MLWEKTAQGKWVRGAQACVVCGGPDGPVCGRVACAIVAGGLPRCPGCGELKGHCRAKAECYEMALGSREDYR